MSLNDPRFINFDGSSVTGRVPPALRVAEGRELTPTQAGAVAHAYKLFKDAANVSVAEFLVQNRTLSDGTRVRLVSIQGQDTVTVWPTGGERKAFSLRGFVVSPLAVMGHTLPDKLKQSILTVRDKTLKWVPFVYGYRPGGVGAEFGYSISATKFSGKEVKVGISKFITWAGRMVRQFVPVSDDKYNDVFLAHGRALYKNGVSFRSFPLALPGGVPVVFETPGERAKAVFVDNNKVSAVYEGNPLDPSDPLDPPALVVAYDWRAFADPYAMLAVKVFNTGVEVDHGLAGGARKTRYLSYNKTLAGALQVCVATAELLPGPPYASVTAQEMSQLNVEGVLNAMTGWVTEDAVPAGAPVISEPTARSNLIGHNYSALDGGVYAGEITSAGWYMGVTVPNTANGKETFDHIYSLPESVKLNESEFISIERKSTIYSVTKRNSATYYNTWPHSNPLLTGSTDALLFTGGCYMRYGLTFGGGRIYAGQPVTGGYSEVGARMEHQDNAVCRVTVPGIPKRIYDATATHNISGVAGTGISTELGTTEGLSISSTSLINYFLVFVKSNAAYPTLQTNVYKNVSSKLGTNSFTAKATDYIYSDRHNEVFVWVEAEIISNSTNEALDTGSSSITVRACIQFNGEKTYTALYSANYDVPREVAKMDPWGLGFAYSECSWDYITPHRPDPVYAPLWQDQGMCPYIAYTTKEEIAEGVVPKIAAHFRLFLYRHTRGVLEDDPPEHPSVVAFPIYMCEQLMSHWGVPPATVISAIEAQPTIIKLALPDADLFANVGAPTDDAAHYAKFYRT